MGDGERKPERDPTGSPESAADAASGAGDEVEATGVFGSLPRSRPGRRSPRRAPAAPEEAAAPVTQKAMGHPPEPGREERAETTEPSEHVETSLDEAASPAGQRGLEDLAWAGVAIAAEAATLGIRIANRALEAMRGDAERP
jgi:hypothetical protein